MHLLGLVIQLLTCTWGTAALWPRGIAALSRHTSLCAQIPADPLQASQREGAALAGG